MCLYMHICRFTCIYIHIGAPARYVRVMQGLRFRGLTRVFIGIMYNRIQSNFQYSRFEIQVHSW